MSTMLSLQDLSGPIPQAQTLERRYRPHVRPVGPKVGYDYVNQEVQTAAIRVVKAIQGRYEARRRDLRKQFDARVGAIERQVGSKKYARDIAGHELRAQSNALQVNEKRDIETAIQSARVLKGQVQQRYAPYETPEDTRYQYATSREAPVLRDREMKDVPPFPRQFRMESSVAQTEIGARPTLTIGSWDVYERGWPYQPDLLEQEIERAGVAGVGTLVEDELLAWQQARQQVTGVGVGYFLTSQDIKPQIRQSRGAPQVSGLGIMETLFLI